MGAGKTTVGGIVAHLLQYEFLDTDRIIEARENRRIVDLFATEGEPYFREKEHAICLELENASGKVISTGGGLFIDPKNQESLRRHALVVCLWARADTIYDRLKHQTHRPLLQTPDPLSTIRELLDRRGPSYRQADVLVGVDFRSPADTARHIANSFRRVHGHPIPLRDDGLIGFPPLASPLTQPANPACPPPAPSAISPAS